MKTSMGQTTKTLFYKEAANGVLHHEFPAAAQVRPGEAVVLNADGTVQPAVTATPGLSVIGIAMTHAADNTEEVVVKMRAQAIIYAKTAGALDAGPIKQNGFNTDDASTSFDNGNNTVGAVFHGHPIVVDEGATATDLLGWNLQQQAGAAETLVAVCW